MSKTMYLVIAIIIIILLIAIFFITYVLNKRTPVPIGCEKIQNEHCIGCSNKHCEHYIEEEKQC